MWSKRHNKSLTVSERILASVSKDDTGCWTWVRSTDRDGYGQFRFQSRQWIAHRASYEQFVGPIPSGLTLDHLCRNRRCVNPAHLEPVVHKENVRRGLPHRSVKAVTHCRHGHAFDKENTYVFRGSKRCRKCHAARARMRRSGERQTKKVKP